MDHDQERGILVISMPKNRFVKSVNNELIGISPNSIETPYSMCKYFFCTDNLEKYTNHISKEHNIDGQYVYFMDLNRHSKNIIIVQFPQGTGGSFLMSCLNLSNDVAKYISKKDKKRYIEGMLSKSRYTSKHFDPINFSFCWEVDDVERSINNNEITFIPTHHYDQENFHKCVPTKKFVNFFHNAKVLKFDNWISFYIIRKYFPNISFDDYYKFGSEKKNKLTSLFLNSKKDSRLLNHCSDVYKDIPDYVWDTSNFFNKECFLNGIEKLYNDIGLSDFDGEYIGWYYDQWTHVMRNWERHK